MFNADTIWKLFFSTTWYFFFTTNNIIVKFISLTTTFWIRFHKFFNKLKRFSFLIYYELHYCWAHIYYRHPGWQAPLRKIRRSYNVPNLQKKKIGVAPPSRFRKMSFNRIGHGRCIPNNVYSVLTLNLGLEASSFLSFSSKSTNLRDTFSTIPCKSLYSA